MLILSILIILWIIMTILMFTHDTDVYLSPNVCTCRKMVICVGLPRTATCSLSKALSILGYSVQHFPINLKSKIELYKKKRNALVDLAMLNISPQQLHMWFPDAVFIYTDRDDEDWVRSMFSLHDILKKCAAYIPRMKNVYMRFIKTYGTTKNTFIQRKREYEKEINKLSTKTHVACINLVNKKNSDMDKWIDIGNALGITDSRFSYLRFPNEYHVMLHVKQVWKLL